MRLPFYIATRYLFSKKRHNAINIVSMICAAGVCIGTLALVCILSVYNGFQNLISTMYNVFDPDVKICLVQGKTFDGESDNIDKVRQLPFVASCADVLEENALIKYGEKQTSVTLKGVSDNYINILNTDSIIKVGSFTLSNERGDYAVVGLTLANQMDVNLYDPTPLTVYTPKHDTKINLSNPSSAFNEEDTYISGIYCINQESTEAQYIFVPIKMARQMFDYTGNENTAVEINLKPGTDTKDAITQIQEIVGNKYKVLDKKEQHEDFYRMLKTEKWITFLILIFILLIAAFNVIGSLTMLIIEKEGDISTLKSLGATTQTIRQIFLLEGWMISALGALIGTALGVILCVLQQVFGFIKLGNGSDAFVIDAYPVSVEATDVITILASVLIIGFIIAWFPTRYIQADKFQEAKSE